MCERSFVRREEEVANESLADVELLIQIGMLLLAGVGLWVAMERRMTSRQDRRDSELSRHLDAWRERIDHDTRANTQGVHSIELDIRELKTRADRTEGRLKDQEAAHGRLEEKMDKIADSLHELRGQIGELLRRNGMRN